MEFLEPWQPSPDLTKEMHVEALHGASFFLKGLSQMFN
jgi:hypothetical protein